MRKKQDLLTTPGTRSTRRSIKARFTVLCDTSNGNARCDAHGRTSAKHRTTNTKHRQHRERNRSYDNPIHSTSSSPAGAGVKRHIEHKNRTAIWVHRKRQ